MDFLAQTTQQAIKSYTPDDVANAIVKVIGAMSLVLIPALVALWKAIQTKAMTEALDKKVDQNRQAAVTQLSGMQQQITNVAMATPVAVAPPKAEDFIKDVPKG